MALLEMTSSSVRFNVDETQQLFDVLLSPSTDVTLGLCFLFVVPLLVEHNEQSIIDWLLPTMSALATDDKLLMIGLFCMTNYNEVDHQCFLSACSSEDLPFF